MRFDKTVQLLRTARMLAASAEGVPMARLVQEIGVGRRTIERMLGAIEELFGPVERLPGDGASKLYRLPQLTEGRMLTKVRADELAELSHAINAARSSDTEGRADLLATLHEKLRASMRATERNRIAADLEGLLEAEALGRRPGPHARVPAQVLETLRDALLQGHAVGFRYEGRDKAFDVVPWGILFGLRSYLVCAFEGHEGDPYLYRLDRMSEVTVLPRSALRPEEFDLDAFAARSFGTFQEEPQDIVLHFTPAAAPDARAFEFHPTQTIEECEDGSIVVSFTAGGLRQIAHHLFSWGGTVRIEAPEALRNEMASCLDAARDTIARSA